jgi:hypothetical protein
MRTCDVLIDVVNKLGKGWSIRLSSPSTSKCWYEISLDHPAGSWVFDAFASPHGEILITFIKGPLHSMVRFGYSDDPTDYDFKVTLAQPDSLERIQRYFNEYEPKQCNG